MFDPQQVLVFAGIALLMAMTPGADTMLVLRTVMARGRRAGILATLGICSGLPLHALLSALGLSAILMRSAEAFEVVKWVGAGYLAFLGARSLFHAIRGQHMEASDAPGAETAARQTDGRRSFLEGLFTNLLNPKVALFYLALLPQFVSSPETAFFESMTFATIHLVLSLLWLFIVVAFVARLRAVVTSSRVKRGMEAVTGTIFVGLGVRLALEQP
jgi:RhtB (resistance to homoserine/threonine) family protein